MTFFTSLLLKENPPPLAAAQFSVDWDSVRKKNQFKHLHLKYILTIEGHYILL